MGDNRRPEGASEKEKPTGQEQEQEQEQDLELEEGGTQEQESEGSEKETEGEKSFMDPNTLPPELKEPFRRMQASFTRAMQGVAGERQKAQFYDQLMSGENVESAIQTIAAKAGLKVVRGEVVEKDTGHKADDSPTVRFIKDLVNAGVKEALAPAMEEVTKAQQQYKAEVAIAFLNTNYPDWYLYETTMADLAIKHPTLRSDPAELYRLAKVKDEEVEGVVEGSEKRVRVSTKASVGRSAVAGPKKAESIDEAFAMAKKQHGLK